MMMIARAARMIVGTNAGSWRIFSKGSRSRPILGRIKKIVAGINSSAIIKTLARSTLIFLIKAIKTLA